MLQRDFTGLIQQKCAEQQLEPSTSPVPIIFSTESGTEDLSLSAGAHNLERNNYDHQQHGPPVFYDER